jgi:aminoglycoside phosphotransferase (APT) family kinase protein
VRVAAEKMHPDEVDIDIALVSRLLAAQFPQWADLPIEPVLSTGTVNAMYRLGDDLAVRLPRVQQWAADLQKEQQWLPKLAPYLPLAVPESVAKGSPGDGYPFHWGVYRWLEGETWITDRVGDLAEAAGQLAQFIVALQRIDAAGGPHPYPGGCGAPLIEGDPYVRAAIANAHGMIDTDAVTAAWDAALAAPPWTRPPVWVHGDLKPSNLLIAEGRLRAVIDFGGISVGDPACEVAAAWSLFSSQSRAAFREGLAVDDATWARGRGWALRSIQALPYYFKTNPGMVIQARHTLEQLLADTS